MDNVNNNNKIPFYIYKPETNAILARYDGDTIYLKGMAVAKYNKNFITSLSGKRIGILGYKDNKFVLAKATLGDEPSFVATYSGKIITKQKEVINYTVNPVGACAAYIVYLCSELFDEGIEANKLPSSKATNTITTPKKEDVTPPVQVVTKVEYIREPQVQTDYTNDVEVPYVALTPSNGESSGGGLLTGFIIFMVIITIGGIACLPDAWKSMFNNFNSGDPTAIFPLVISVVAGIIAIVTTCASDIKAGFKAYLITCGVGYAVAALALGTQIISGEESFYAEGSILGDILNIPLLIIGLYLFALDVSLPIGIATFLICGIIHLIQNVKNG